MMEAGHAFAVDTGGFPRPELVERRRLSDYEALQERYVQRIERLTHCHERLARVDPQNLYAFNNVREAIQRVAAMIQTGSDT